MILTRITFLLPADGVPGWKLTELKQLSRLFRSVVVWNNISRGKQANLENGLTLLSFKNDSNDLCQLVIEGLDAELACMVLSAYVSEHFDILATADTRKRPSPTRLSHFPSLTLPFDLQWHFRTDTATDLNKKSILSDSAALASAASSIDLLAALENREAKSSTHLGASLALPHVMHEAVSEPTIVIHRLSSGVNWMDSLPPLPLVITLFMPLPSTREQIVAFTRFSRWLIEEANRALLIENDDEVTVCAIIRHVMNSYQPT